MRALVVDDDESIAEATRRLLEADSVVVDTAPTASDGDRLVSTHDYDLIILDMILPDCSGLEFLRNIRDRGKTTPVLIVSGVDDVPSKVEALDAGADDYLQKPYEGEELRARVRALVRRRDIEESSKIKCGNILLHRMERYATVAGERLNLTGKEFVLLEHFVMNQGKTLSRKQLLEKVWQLSFDPGTNIVDVNVARLRAKLVARGATCRLESERGVGYVFNGA